ncbi:TolB family protein [Schlesneria paludicola]|uniref:TolB family protein n=1 Tax=Schlesneria paludicola TaxID=360056 RepID=UPI00029AB513|nr:PD40 domain-containing protein [Schlesneria paludicola]
MQWNLRRWLPIVTLAICSTAIATSSAAEPDTARTPKYLIGYMGVGGNGTEVAHVLGFICPDGSGERYPDFGHPEQKSWVFGPLFADGRRIVLCSYEDVDRTKVRSGKVVTHDWIYDLITGQLIPALEKHRPADQMRPYHLLPGDQRVIETAYIGNEERIFIKDLDGGNSEELTTEGGGFHYALSLSHDARRLACHVTGGLPSFYNPGFYSINVFDLQSKKRVLVAGQTEHLYFGPQWSPDDRQLAYLDCQAVKDPAHFRADLCVGQADGSGNRVITQGQPHWFGTPFGSNMTEWAPDGKTVTFTRLRSHSTRDMAQGGAQICLLNPSTGDIKELTPAEEGTWDYRATWHPDGHQIAFARVRQKGPRTLWIMDADGSNPKPLTEGYHHKGADHFRWLRVDDAVR